MSKASRLGHWMKGFGWALVAGAVGGHAAALELEGPRWVLLAYTDAEGKNISALQECEVTAAFENGRLSGSAGCNRYTAPYTAREGELKVAQLAYTKKLCSQPIMTQEEAFLAHLQGTAQYKIQKEQLLMLDGKGKAVLCFKADKPASLTEGTWLMTFYNNGKEAVVSALEGIKVTAVFAEGKVSGSGGCNTYGASYSVENTGIKLGSLFSTKMACEAAVMEQESRYFAALQTASTYRIDGKSLELRTASGAMAASFQLQTAK